MDNIFRIIIEFRIKESGVRIKELAVNGKLLSSTEYFKSLNLKFAIRNLKVSCALCFSRNGQRTTDN
jgi:hypothetical protein